MTDLENLWEDYPTGPAPTDAILRDARRAEMVDDSIVAAAASTVRNAERRRRLVLRPLLTAGVATAVVGAFLVGNAMNGGGGGGSTPGGHQPDYVAFQADLAPATSCDELLDSYVDRGLDLVGAWGWQQRIVQFYNGLPLDLDVGSMPMNGLVNRTSAELSDQKVPAPSTDRQVNSETGTNVQEAGVDEPDNVKTDGSILARVKGEELELLDVSGDRVRGLSSLRLSGISSPEIILAGDTIVAVGEDQRAVRREDGTRSGTRVISVDISDPEAPEVAGEVTYSASAASVRQHGDAIRLVLSTGLPDLDFKYPHRGFSQRKAIRFNRAQVEKSTIEDWLPTYEVSGGSGDSDRSDSEQLLDCTDVALTPDEVGLDTVAVVGFDAASPTKVDAIGLAGATDLAYESVDHLYLVSSPGWNDGCINCSRLLIGSRAPQAQDGTSYLFDFALDGTRATHVASGEVEGDIRDRWSMDEADGVLRVAVGPTSDTGNFNSVVTMERKGQDLVEIGRLDRLGVNEQIQSVRWFDDLAILVTFRRVDPLYAVDLTDIRRPTKIGKLKIPGFSSYLHPLGSMRMIGMGEGPGPKGRWGAQMGLFNVTDLTKPRRLDVLAYGANSNALAGQDPRSFTWMPEHRTVLTVIEKWQRTRVGYLSITHIERGKLHNKMVQVEYGDDVDLVRTVPVGDGRVVLVTGERVRFLDLK